MRGVIFLIPILVLSVYYGIKNPQILPLAFVTIGFGFVGFIDYFIKVAKKRKDGLYWKQKMLGLLLIAVSFSFYIYHKGIGTEIMIPFLGMDKTIALGWFFIPFTVLVLISATNL